MHVTPRLVEGRLVPVRVRDPIDILYGTRTTSFIYQVLDHDPDTGIDDLAGYLDGVIGSNSSWQTYETVKGSANLTVRDLKHPKQGWMGLRDVDWFTQRIRPLRHIEGIHAPMDGEPLGTFFTLEAPESHSGTGTVVTVGLHEKSGILDQDGFPGVYVADTAIPILQQVAKIIASSGETCDIDMSVTDRLANPKTFTGADGDIPTKLDICNQLLDVINYSPLTTDGWGRFILAPYMSPADRPVMYDVLGVPRELLDGPRSIYEPEWTMDRDYYRIPNVVVAWGQPSEGGEEDSEPLWAAAINDDPNSQFSTVKRKRTIVNDLTGVDVPAGSIDAQLAFLGSRAMRSLIQYSSPQATVVLKCLWMPIQIGDVVRFANSPSRVAGWFVVTSVDDDHSFDGRMELSLQEVLTI